MKTFLRATALTLSLIFVMTGFAVPFAALRASAAETGEGLGPRHLQRPPCLRE